MTEIKRTIWNHTPTLPIENSAVFTWPPRPHAALKHLLHRWVDISATALFLVISILMVKYILPDPQVTKILALGWIAKIYVTNVALTFAITGGLHLVLFTFSAQGKKMKYDTRPMMKNIRTFTFRDQVHDNMFWTLVGGVTAWTFFEVLYFWAAGNGWVTILTISESPVWFGISLLLLPIFTSMHFYWIHRLLHWPPLYRRVHSLHHRNINIGPWSGMSMHPVESFIYVSAVLIHFIIPSHLLIFMTHLLLKSLGPAFSHAGFEKVLIGNDDAIDAGDFHHQLHHRYFECNYGTTEMPWDAWFGTFHNGSDEAAERIKERRKRMYSTKRDA